MHVESLDREIHAYEGLLASIRSAHGSVWALVVREKLIKTFSRFADAARFANANYPGEQVLIRHTDERVETAPFIQIS